MSFIARTAASCMLAVLKLTKNGPTSFLIIVNPVAIQGSLVHVMA